MGITNLRVDDHITTQKAYTVLGSRAVIYRNGGTEVDLIELIEAQHGPVLLGCLRHDGCTLCRKQTADCRAIWVTL